MTSSDDNITLDEKKKQVLELYYNERKNTREIAKIMRMSLRDIGNILKENKERKKQESIYHNVDNGGDKDNGGKEDQQHQSIAVLELSDKQKAAKAYEFYNKGKTPVQVATKLCLFAKEATTYYLDFWKLKRHYQLYQIYPEIQPYLPGFVKLFKELKKQGLNSQNVKWFVDGLNIGTIKIEDVYADFENLKANNQNLRNENENLRNENQNLRYENQELIRQIQYNKRMFENDSLAMQKHIADLSELSEQQQQNVDTLSERIEKLYNKEQKQKLVVSKFGDTNKKYRKIKNIVKEHVDELLKQTEQNQKAVLSIALISIIQALKDNPDKYNVIFNNNNTNECQQELVAIVQTFYRNLVDEHVSQTMALLESKAESESEDIEEDIASTETETETENVEATTEEETKPPEE